MAMPGAADETLFATIFALLALSTLPAGRLIMAIGAARRGQLAKSVPYPVVGGFFAAIGHFLPKNGALLSVGGLGGGMAILSAEGLRRWLPPVAGGVAGALVARAGGIRFAAFLGVLACLALFHGWLSVTGTSIARARGEGLLLASGIGPWGRGWLSSLQALGTIDASVILGQLPAMPSVAALALPGVLLCLSGIEHMTGRPVDLNRALRTTGWANLGCGLGGGFVGDHRRR
jgi:SulP family sulfate permease